MLNIVVVAGGKQTRFKELSIFPKVLLPIVDAPSLLTKFMKTATDDAQAINRYIVISKEHADKLVNYIEVNNLQDKIKVIVSTNSNGSFNTLREVRDQLPKENVLFVWGDLSITSYKGLIKTCTEDDHRGIVFTNNASRYRYGASRYTLDDPRMALLDKIYFSSSESGNIPGIYFLKTTKLLYRDYNDTRVRDLVDAIGDDVVLAEHGGVDVPQFTQELEDNPTFNKYYGLSYRVVDISEVNAELVEYKDLGTYINLMKSDKKIDLHRTRFFNEIDIDLDNKIVTKRVVDPAYKHLSEKEIAWYKVISSCKDDPKIAPTFYNEVENGYCLQYLEGYKSIYEVLNELESKMDIQSISRLVDNTFDMFDRCNAIQTKTVDFDIFCQDLKWEIVDKVVGRCEKVKSLILNYRKDDLEAALTRAYNYLKDFATRTKDYDKTSNSFKYCFCHSDPHTSNLMVDPRTLDVKMIDPRAYFGKTEMYGWRAYDDAKVLYSLYGFDEVNLEHMIYMKDWPRVRESVEYSGLKSRFGNEYNNYIMLLATVYIALAGYISQDIMKMNIVYDYGLRLLKWSMEDYEKTKVDCC